MTPASKILNEALRFAGQNYRFGAEGDTKPYEWLGDVDCSELVQIACSRAGVVPTVPDGAYNQWRHCNPATVDQAKHTPGALLFIGSGRGTGRQAITHVGFSLGGGYTFEARSTAFGVGKFGPRNSWTHGGLLPGVDYLQTTSQPQPLPTLKELALMTYDLSGIIAFVDLVYGAYGRGPTSDMKGRVFWVNKARHADKAGVVLDEMLTVFEANEGAIKL